MLIGSFNHSMQAKGRLAIPAPFRQELGKQPIMTRGLETCVSILPFEIWSNTTAQLGNNPLAGKTTRNLRRLLAHEAYPVEYDAQGRILIPQSLRDWARLDKKVVVAGSIDWIEIWDLGLYKENLAQIQVQGADIVEKLDNE